MVIKFPRQKSLVNSVRHLLLVMLPHVFFVTPCPIPPTKRPVAPLVLSRFGTPCKTHLWPRSSSGKRLRSDTRRTWTTTRLEIIRVSHQFCRNQYSVSLSFYYCKWNILRFTRKLASSKVTHKKTQSDPE